LVPVLRRGTDEGPFGPRTKKEKSSTIIQRDGDMMAKRRRVGTMCAIPQLVSDDSAAGGGADDNVMASPDCYHGHVRTDRGCWRGKEEEDNDGWDREGVSSVSIHESGYRTPGVSAVVGSWIILSHTGLLLIISISWRRHITRPTTPSHPKHYP